MTVLKLKPMVGRDSGRLYVGDNLQSLRGLESESVDLVYADPPYNTAMFFGSVYAEEEGWSDKWAWSEEHIPNFNTVSMKEWERMDLGPAGHRLKQVVLDIALDEDPGGKSASKASAYAAFMIPRLVEIHRVLAPSGTFFLHVNDIESHNLIRICNIIFGREFRQSKLIWKSSGTKKSARKYSRTHDEILHYVKSKNFNWQGSFRDFSPQEERQFKYDDRDGRGPYKLARMVATKRGTERTYSLEYKGFDADRDLGKAWAIPTSANLGTSPGIVVHPEYEVWRRTEGERARCLQWMEDNGLAVWRSGVLEYKVYLESSLGIAYGTTIPPEIVGMRVPMRFYTEETGDYRTQKPPALLRLLIESSTSEGDLVLDPFAGSGVTGAVAHSMRRKWALMDLSDSAAYRLPHMASLLPAYWSDTKDKYGRFDRDPYGLEMLERFPREVEVKTCDPNPPVTRDLTTPKTAFERRMERV